MDSHNHKHSECCNHKHHEHKHGECCNHEHHEHKHGECCNHEHHEHKHGECCNHEHHEHKHGECCTHKHHEHKHDSTCSCGCSHTHHHYSKKDLTIKGVSVVLFVISILLEAYPTLSLLICLLATLLCGYEIFAEGIKSLARIKFDENTLIVLAVVASFIMKEQHEGYFITVLFSIGQFLEGYALSKSQEKIENLIGSTNDTAHNEHGEEIDPQSIKPGDVFLVKKGDKVCVDAVIVDGTGIFDTSAITGESIPSDISKGEKVISGYINIGSPIMCRATSDYENSTSSKIKKYVQNAGEKKAKTESFITKFASIYTPSVIGIAVVMGIALAAFGITTVPEALKRALTFMIASCPCAIVISIPLAYYAAIGAMSRYGLLVKGSKYINEMAKADAIVFDKTGTLTKGTLKVCKVTCFDNTDTSDVLSIAKSLEIHSLHPAAEAICRAFDGAYEKAENITEHIGRGIEGYIGTSLVVAGTWKLAAEKGYSIPEESNGIFVYKDAVLCGIIEIEDEIRDEAKSTVDALTGIGFDKICILSGDNKDEVAKTASILGISATGELSPNEKALRIAELKKSSKSVIYAGDGVNDAPSLSEANFSVSIGSGSSLALETGDATLVARSLNAIPLAIKKARYTVFVIYSNLILAIGLKLAVLVLAALGGAPIWLAVLADVGTLIITVLNSLTVFFKR